MSEDSTNILEGKEARVLRAVRKALTGIVKDTATAPGMKHPLSEHTIEDIRQCLGLIAAREQELLQEAGIDNGAKPYFTDDPRAQNSVVVPIGRPKGKKKKDEE
ncbi:MAG: hypothetical protein AMJ68_03855 [Acidithiobacillales bacterium SG8_45]|nr:MAG: hypothetical protein AMJ68_03855 [Acidithiobacillales bacterium SG8_45]